MVTSDIKVNDELYEKLVAKRKDICEEKRIPPYIIFHNTALEEMSFYMPDTKEKFLEIKGVGSKKYDNYGELFMDIIKEYKKSIE